MSDDVIGLEYLMPCTDINFRLSTLEGEWHEFESKRERARKRRRIEAPQ